MSVQIVFLFVSLSIIVYVIWNVSKSKLLEAESVIWVLGAVFAFMLTLFPKDLAVISKWIGIQYPPAAFFLIVVVFLSIISFRQFLMISKLTTRTTDLIQKIAILENECEQLQKHRSVHIESLPQEIDSK
jgi:hypothetical protein